MITNYLITPQGNFINLQDGTRPTASTDTIVWANSVGTVITETYASNEQAAWLATLLSNAISSGANINPNFTTLQLLYGSTEWISINPNTLLVVNHIGTLLVTGSGFTSLNITNMKLDDGSGHVIVFPGGGGDTLIVNSDTMITLSDTVDYPPAAATYTLYYSVNSGGSYTTTNLTVVAS